MLLLALLLFQSPQEAYYAWGWHGGYYLTNEVATRGAFVRLFKLLGSLPHLKAVLWAFAHQMGFDDKLLSDELARQRR
jgi:hypothetical protein